MHITTIKIFNTDIMNLRLNEANHIERVKVMRVCLHLEDL